MPGPMSKCGPLLRASGADGGWLGRVSATCLAELCVGWARTRDAVAQRPRALSATTDLCASSCAFPGRVGVLSPCPDASIWGSHRRV